MAQVPTIQVQVLRLQVQLQVHRPTISDVKKLKKIHESWLS